jgi:hypothetical protein
MPQDVASWIQDGTPATEPVTTETPAPAAAEEAAPAPEETQPTGPARDEHGRFTSAEERAATGEQPAAAAEAAAPADGASAQEIVDFIEAQLGEGETFKIPKGVRLPLKRGADIEYVELEELQRRGMLEKDYRHKTGELAQERRAYEQRQTQMQAQEARLRAREEWIQEQEELAREAQTDPEKFAAFEEHLRQYAENPYYRKNVDAALRQRETEAVNEVYRQRDDQEVVSSAVEAAIGWIDEIAGDEKYQHVDKDRVRSLYAQRLSANQATLDPAEVRALFDQEADYLSRSVSPLQQQLADLKAQVETLQASTAGKRQNETTAHAVNRAKTPPVITGSSAPGSGQRPEPKPFGIRELPDRISQWARNE